MEDIQGKNNAVKGICIIGKLIPMRSYVLLLIDRTNRFIGATVDYENCIIRFLLCLNVNAGSHVLLMYQLQLWKIIGYYGTNEHKKIAECYNAKESMTFV